MKLENEVIELRAIELSDADLLLELLNDPEMEYNLGGWSFPASMLDQKKWIESLNENYNTFRAVIVEKNTKTPVGTAIMTEIDFKNGTSEIHIKIKKEFQGKKLGSQTISLVTEYAFNELRLNCVYAKINSYNVASQKLFETKGFKKEGCLRERIFKNGKYHDVNIYSLLSSEL